MSGFVTPSAPGGNDRMRSLNSVSRSALQGAVRLRRVLRLETPDGQQGRQLGALAPEQADVGLGAQPLALGVGEAAGRVLSRHGGEAGEHHRHDTDGRQEHRSTAKASSGTRRLLSPA